MATNLQFIIVTVVDGSVNSYLLDNCFNANMMFIN